MDANLSSPSSYQFPAILIAGMPNCGKSVLAFLLSQHLRRIDLAHYLLRTAPDGEGDWFLQGEAGVVRTLRRENKGAYTSEFIAHMQRVIENRLVPLLVDVGGLPQGEQFGILRACTHAILLYKDEEGRVAWHENLRKVGVPLLAELKSNLDFPGEITQIIPYLQGTISGLRRESPSGDLTFGALFDRIAGLCHYETAYLEQIHLRQAQYPPIVERNLMVELDSKRAEGIPDWHIKDLPYVARLVPPQTPCSLYGRGPVWLAAMLGIHAGLAPMTIYDVRYGWLPIPEIIQDEKSSNLFFEKVENDSYIWLTWHIIGGYLEPGPIKCHPIENPEKEKGLVLSGQLPRWAFVALARWFAPYYAWLGIGDARSNSAIVVHSNLPHIHLGLKL